MARTPSTPKAPKHIGAFTHSDARRANIPTAEYQTLMRREEQAPVRLSLQKRNPDLDPQLVWRGKYDGDESLTVQAPPLYIQEKVHPKVLVEDLMRQSKAGRKPAQGQASLFADFNGMPEGADRTDFYSHEQNWTNRMILGDSLQVMASLSEREGLRGKVQCIYMDPPYGIKFNSNFQWSTRSRDVKDGKADNLTREPEQVKAFRDTWKDGIHSYLSYLRDRFILARDLLTESGSIFVQIGDENVHLIKTIMNEVFGEHNYVNMIAIKKKGATPITESVFDYILWFSKNIDTLKINKLVEYRRSVDEDEKFNALISPDLEIIKSSSLNEKIINEKINNGWKWARVDYPIVSQHPSDTRSCDYIYKGELKQCPLNGQWRFSVPNGMDRLYRANRLFGDKGNSLGGIVYHCDRPTSNINNLWNDVKGEANPIYVVQTAWKIIQRCILMTTDPGDLVLDPTCGSGTTAYMAEQWGRRWITIDTSRVALALARARIMGARYPWYLMADSKEGQAKEAELNKRPSADTPVFHSLRLGFVYERVPHITLKSIANNAEIDVIYDKWQQTLEPLRAALNKELNTQWEEWEIPREAGGTWSEGTWGGSKLSDSWSKKAKELHAAWWKARISRQQEIDQSIAAKADNEFLYDRPYEDKKTVRVAGPFTVESLSPHRMLNVGADGELLDPASSAEGEDGRDFVAMILENLKSSGVQQARKEDKIVFTSLTPWPGTIICAEGRYMEGETERRAGIFLGPEFGTVNRQDLAQAAREAADAGFDMLLACAFNYEAHTTDFDKLGRLPVLKARMNADLHMAEDLKNTGKGNLFVVFGEPDITIVEEKDASGTATGRIRVRVNGVDVFKPSTGEIISDNADDIACWFVDTDYNEESFFVRQAYFLGQNDPYKALKTTLKAEIDQDAWESLHSSISRPFDKPESGRIAVKVINHLGDEVMKVFRV